MTWKNQHSSGIEVIVAGVRSLFRIRKKEKHSKKEIIVKPRAAKTIYPRRNGERSLRDWSGSPSLKTRQMMSFERQNRSGVFIGLTLIVTIWRSTSYTKNASNYAAPPPKPMSRRKTSIGPADIGGKSTKSPAYHQLRRKHNAENTRQPTILNYTKHFHKSWCVERCHLIKVILIKSKEEVNKNRLDNWNIELPHLTTYVYPLRSRSRWLNHLDKRIKELHKDWIEKIV